LLLANLITFENLEIQTQLLKIIRSKLYGKGFQPLLFKSNDYHSKPDAIYFKPLPKQLFC